MNSLKLILVWLLAAVCLAVIGTSGVVLYLILVPAQSGAPVNQLDDEQPALPITSAPAVPIQLPATTLTVYFAVENNPHEIRSETRSVNTYGDLLSRVVAAVEELAKGPKRAQLRNPLPPRTKVRAVFLDDDRGIAYVDLSSEFINGMPQGISQAGQTVYALVNTVARVDRNKITKVQLLVDGRVIDRPVSHLNLSRPLEPEWSWVGDG